MPVIAEETCLDCGHIRRTYARPFPTAELRGFHELYRQTLRGAEWVHVYDLLGEGNIKQERAGGGDWAKLRYWELIEERSNDDPTKKNCGYWRITQDGQDFIEDLRVIRSHVIILESECIGFWGKWVSIQTVRAGGKFDFSELMERS